MLFGRTRTSSTPPPPDLEIQARLHRDRMAGLWAAELLGLIGHAAHDYAHDYAHDIAQGHDHAKDGDDSIAGRLARDLRGKASMAEIRAKLANLLHEARRQRRG